MPWENVYVGNLFVAPLDQPRIELAGSRIEANIKKVDDSRLRETETIPAIPIQGKKMQTRHRVKNMSDVAPPPGPYIC